MKKLLLPFFVLLLAQLNAQLLSWSPDFVQQSSTPVLIKMNAGFGNKGLLNYNPTNDVYVHIGVITNKSNGQWVHVPFTWATTPAAARCQYLSNNEWAYRITGGLRSYFGLTDSTEKILKIGILFRNGAGTVVQRNADASDMYIPVYDDGIYTRIDEPFSQPTFVPQPEPLVKQVGDSVFITATASKPGKLSVYFNGNLLGTTNETSISAKKKITKGGDQFIASVSTLSGFIARDTFMFTVAVPSPVAALPEGVTDGINYSDDKTSVTLVFFAPGKNSVFVKGDFTNWITSTNFLMNKTPDGNRFWITLKNLKPQVEYAYQFVIDGNLVVADYSTEKILDPYNDQYISSSTYPGLKAYPTSKTTGIVSILQTGKPAYKWQVKKFNRPNKQSLVIYELLVRDFTAQHNWSSIQNKLDYIQKLGVNAIELMPFNEFEGNSSWGYNPSFYFAPDKYYGTETALKQFIDECHKRGLAVIMDMVMNHSFGQSPMVQMYFDRTKNVPSTDNPWFNQYAKHPYNVGYDFNHESPATQYFVNRVIDFWLTNYKLDGMRWDLAKGFTQKQTCDATGNNCDEAAFAAYDQSRINIWKKYYADMQAASPGSYCILEMFADSSEEQVESAAGMMLWNNINYNINQNTMGYSDGADLSWGLYQNHGFEEPNLVTYQESHDEERLMFKNEQYGNSSGSYNVKDTTTGLARNEAATAFWSMMPGPKMLWQFGEKGYDYSINRCEDGSINNDCRTSPKPLAKDLGDNAGRNKLYRVYSSLIKLRTMPGYAGTFINGKVAADFSSLTKYMSLTSGKIKIEVVGNFDVMPKTFTAIFPSKGVWYSYLTKDSLNVTRKNFSITLQPGEYYVYTDRKVSDTSAQRAAAISEVNINESKGWKLYPNPAKDYAGIVAQQNFNNAQIIVTDLSGKTLYVKKFETITTGQNIVLPMQFSKGVYLVRLSADELTGVKRLVVQ